MNHHNGPTRASQRKLVEDLRLSLDPEAVTAALKRGDINVRQAKSLTQWISNVRDIHDNPIYWVSDDHGVNIGEIHAKNGGRAYVAKVYGKHFDENCPEFDNLSAATALIQNMLKSQMMI